MYRSVGSQARAFLTSLGGRWSTSIVTRVVGIVLAIGILTAVLGSAIVISEVRTRLYDRTIASLVDQFSTTVTQAQYSVDTMNGPTAGQIQQFANNLIAQQYDPVQSLYGGALLRGSNPGGTAFSIAEPVTQSTVEIRRLLSQDLRRAVRSGSGATYWQPVELARSDGRSDPGIVLGRSFRLGGAGNYEFYAVYSLGEQEAMLSEVSRILMIAQIVMIAITGLAILALVRYVIQPVREASRGAQRLAAGAFDVHMNDEGEDELAELGRSFNQMADSIQAQITELERLSKVQRDFVSAVSHELRTPVTTIRMAGQLIYDKRGELSPAMRRAAELQHKQLINLDVMLADLLEIFRYDAGAMVLQTSRTNLVDIVRRVVENSAPLAVDNNVKVAAFVQGDTYADVEPRRVERIVRNLVVNALEHAPGGHVWIRVVGGTSAVAVEVSDDGVGLSPEQAEHAFDRFWRADESRVRKSGGTGLGLTIAREDALLHGGRLQATGKLGVGATFLLTLPRKQGAKWVAPLELRVGAEEGVDPNDGSLPLATDSADEETEARGPSSGPKPDARVLTGEMKPMPDARVLTGELRPITPGKGEGALNDQPPQARGDGWDADKARGTGDDRA